MQRYYTIVRVKDFNKYRRICVVENLKRELHNKDESSYSYLQNSVKHN